MGIVALILTTFTIVVLITISISSMCNIFIFKGDLKTKVKEIYSYCLHFVSLVFSTISIALCCPRVIDKGNLGFDYIGVIVGILSLLVAVLIGWNIYTVVDFNKKIEITEEKSKSIGVEFQKLKLDYQELKKQFENMQSESTFSRIFDYARKMDSSHYTQYAIDGYMDALNVAVTDKLGQDRIDVVIQCIRRIIKHNDMSAHHLPLPILPNKRNFYFEILSNVRPQNEDVRSLCEYMLNEANTKDDDTAFPSWYIRISSTYNQREPNSPSE